MCGIAGVVEPDGVRPEPALLRRMIEMIHYRGPDECGFHLDRNVGLGHARLSIIDVAHGQQPMHNEDRTLSITFNGEIFNYLELREELIQKGHRFRTDSDTEVILHLYQERGEQCVKKLNGQWAFAIWDVTKERLFLSRDRMGVRPLFHTLVDGAFLFASEMKAIFADPRVSRQIDLSGLDQIFTFWASIAPRTIFRGISQLAPGHSMTVQGREIKIWPHWQLEHSNRLEEHRQSPLNERETAAQLLDLITDATRLRLRGDVPAGAYVSGGLDSSVVAAIMRKSTSLPLKTFSVTFDDPEFDESPYQNEVIRLLGAEHRQVRCTQDDINDFFPDVIWHTETPILRTAPVPLFILSRLVRQSGCKVVLTGEGADEILGGYDIFKEAKIRRFWGTFPDSASRPKLLRRLYPYLPNLQAQSQSYLKAFFRVDHESLSSPFFSHRPRWDLTARLRAFYSQDVRHHLQPEDRYNELLQDLPENYSGWDSFCQAQYLETRYLLPGYILSSQSDRVAMAHSVEARFPFLDHRVVEFASSISPALKMKVLNEKYILKRCAENLVPPSVRRRAKQPWRAPESVCFFNKAGRAYAQALLLPERIRKSGLFDWAAVEKLTAKVRRGQAIGIRDNMALVGILSTELLVEQFINRLGMQNANGISQTTAAHIRN